MKNLYEDVCEVLAEHDLKISDVCWVGGEEYSISLGDFIDLAKKTEYDSEFGWFKIARDLKLVGRDWRLEWGECDFKGWWKFSIFPEEPWRQAKISKLVGGTISDIYEEDKHKAELLKEEQVKEGFEQLKKDLLYHQIVQWGGFVYHFR